MTRSRLAYGVLWAVLSGVLVVVPAGSADAAPIDCPTVFPTASAVDGVTGTGYTVERGTTPDPFTATILGRLTDGIAPGIDMIMADLDSPALTRAGGVWEGMSGSPVYTADGRLIGSVSYGLTAATPIAGITPAADMMKLLSPAPGAVSTRSRISVPAQVASRIAGTGDATRTEAAAGFRQLPIPVSVSGAAAGSSKFVDDLSKGAGVRVTTGAARISQQASLPSEITAGSNFVAALSYGDVSIAGVGTTTFVCDGQAIAFGHPFFDTGAVQYTVHPATAVYVQADPVNGPFKVADPGGPVGVVDQDKTIGLHSELAETPADSFAVTSSLVPDGGPAVTGSTTGVYQPWASDIAALHLQTNVIKALGADGGGSAALKFTIRGERSDGRPFTVTRSDDYADPDDVSYAAANDLYSIMAALVEQSFDQVKIVSIDVTGTVSSTVHQYRVTAVQLKEKGTWVAPRGTIRATAGRTIPTRITLTRYRSSKTVVLPLTVAIPTRTQGAVGDLTITDGYGGGGLQKEPTSLTQLLAQLNNAPRGAAMAATLELNGPKSVTTVTLKKTDAPVAQYLKDISLEIKP